MPNKQEQLIVFIIAWTPFKVKEKEVDLLFSHNISILKLEV